MKPFNTFHFSGNITTLEPLTVSLAKSTSKGHQMPKNNGIPYFPSSSLVGALRSAGCKFVIDALAEKGTKLDLNSVYSICQGYVVDNKVSDAILKSRTTTPVDEDESLREANPLLSVFGRWGLAGKFGVGCAYAGSEDQVQSFDGGFRTDIFERDESLLEALDPNDIRRYFELTRDQSEVAGDVGELKRKRTSLMKNIRSATNEDKAVIREEIMKIDQEIKDTKEERGEGKETIRRPIDSMEAIVANTKLSHRMSLKRASFVELGAALYSIANFSRSAQLGGKARHNWGRVEAEWTVRVPQDDFTNKVIGRVGFNEDGFFVEGETLEGAMKKFMISLEEGKFDFTRVI